ncbi:MAG: DUF1592 domain-containing protein [Planctomycetales bacterium]|nr:DUF1592 domain-containing protein [Planctomycetales bacterium]
MRQSAAVCLLTCCLTALDVAAADFAEPLQAFFTEHCADCHNADTREGGLSITGLGRDLGDAATFAQWERLYDRVQVGEMPPPSQKRPRPSQVQQFLKTLAGPLAAAHEARKGTVFRRLNRREYENTMNDLFGTRVELANLLPEDGRSHEFDNVGESLSISMVQLQRYLEAADLVLDAAIASELKAKAPEVKRATYSETSEGQRFIGSAWKQLPDGAVVFFRSQAYPSGMLRSANVRTTGRYKIRVTGYAYQSEKPVTVAIGATTFARGAERPTFAYRAFPPGAPTTVEVTAWLKERYMVELTPWGLHDKDNEIRKNGIESYPGPGFAVQHVELEGPLIDEFPSRGHQLIFAGLQRVEVEPSNPSAKTKPWYRPQFELKLADPPTEVRAVLRRIVTAAFRRPATEQQVETFMTLFEQQRADGASAEAALRTAVAAICCSPEFLFLPEQPGWLDDFALASRLSYFLTRTAPDGELLRTAVAGELRRHPEKLLAQTRRLLADPRRERFVVDFTDAWLNLRDIEFTSPDRNLFPEFDPFLQHSMLEETRRFFAGLVDENSRVRDLIKPDYAWLNHRLAEHYGIEGVESPEVQRVALPAGSVRGGLLGQASVAKVSANGTNTSPVVRGVWVMERLLGETPPPPPAGVPGVEPDIRGASTLRELLDRHRNLDSCSGCHQKIDPPGFAMESFNPIGGWRERFRSLGEGERVDRQVNGRRVPYRLGPAVDASGTVQGAGAFANFWEFRDLLAGDEERLARAFVGKLLTFATGRELGFSDRQAVDQILEQARPDGFQVRELIEMVVLSEVFRRK